MPKFRVAGGAHEFEVRQRREIEKAERQKLKEQSEAERAAAARVGQMRRVNNSIIVTRGERIGPSVGGKSKFIIRGKINSSTDSLQQLQTGDASVVTSSQLVDEGKIGESSETVNEMDDDEKEFSNNKDPGGLNNTTSEL